MWWRRLRYVLALMALCAIATCPSAKRACTAHERAREADQLLDYLAARVGDVVASTGKLPPIAAGPTPQTGCCDRGGVCEPDQDDDTWSAPGWRALDFSIDGDYRYTYSYTPDATGTQAVLVAKGDLDCDGESAIYEVRLVLVDGKLTRTDSRTRPFE